MYPHSSVLRYSTTVVKSSELGNFSVLEEFKFVLTILMLGENYRKIETFNLKLIVRREKG